MRIMHVTAPAGIGGCERVVQMLAAAQRDAGAEVGVVGVFAQTPRDVPERFLTPLQAAGVATHAVHVPGRGYARERAAVAALCRAHRPDVVHLHGYRSDVVDAAPARASGAAVVTTIHGFTGGGFRNRCYEWLQRLAIRRCDAVVAVARPLAGLLLRAGVSAHRLHLVVNAWQGEAPLDRAAARRSLGADPHHFVIGWVGRISSEKGLDILLESLPLLGAIPWRAHVVGDGPQRGALEARARQLGVADRIIWHGLVPNAERLFSGFDAFVLSSRTEGTPVVLFEAMAAEAPIVAARVGGVPDMVSDHEAALCRSEDPEALAGALRELYRHPTAAARRARVARIRLYTEHRPRRWVDRYTQVYEAARAVAEGA